MKIEVRDVPPRAAWALEQAGVHPLLARLFAARGVASADELDAGLARLLPPAGLKGAHAAAVLLADAIAAGASPLSPREADVLELAADGAPVDDIARRAHLSTGTVRNYLSAATAKLGAANRHEAVGLARAKGWI